MEKTKINFDTEGFEEFRNSLEDVKKEISDKLPKFQQLEGQFRKVLDGYAALESKNIKFAGMDCVAMVFKDHIKIMVVDESQAWNAYTKIGDIDEIILSFDRDLKKAELYQEYAGKQFKEYEREIKELKSRKIKMFDWWKQLFTGKW